MLLLRSLRWIRMRLLRGRCLGRCCLCRLLGRLSRRKQFRLYSGLRWRLILGICRFLQSELIIVQLGRYCVIVFLSMNSLRHGFLVSLDIRSHSQLLANRSLPVGVNEACWRQFWENCYAADWSIQNN